MIYIYVKKLLDCGGDPHTPLQGDDLAGRALTFRSTQKVVVKNVTLVQQKKNISQIENGS